ncbi:FAD-dependent thymidylate synthase [Glutamicibacter protophormiae]|uniref:FAD-dependent thymidylate synthase n=1 Tax=Glutamicibacter protophormiae TaxID=37930 RepID=UPI00195816F2|nr:FAD-dependent thymidylate synthase [Glutamicibacter protophormiae]QRQ79158.1 FAD-dependent thymidylate synthase [Glutamicibacter protophormiae]
MTAPTFRTHMTTELINHMGTEQTIVQTARVSTLGTNTRDAEAQGLIRFLMREGHGTPFESCTLTFRFEVPIFVSRQIVKHRISSINEESGRYKELEPIFYVPDIDRKVVQVGKTGDYKFTPNRFKNWAGRQVIKLASRIGWMAYRVMLKIGIAKEVARMVLPVNIYSTMYVTMNLRAWLNFVKLRSTIGEGHPQHEIALVGDQVADKLTELYPVVMNQFKESQAIV